MTIIDSFVGGRFYVAESDQFHATERVLDFDGTCSPEDALLHAIAFFTSDEHCEEVNVGDRIRISGPYPIGGDVSTIYTITQQHLDDEGHS